MKKLLILLFLGAVVHLASAQNFIDTALTMPTATNGDYGNAIGFDVTLGSGVYLIQVTDKSTILVYFGRVIVE